MQLKTTLYRNVILISGLLILLNSCVPSIIKSIFTKETFDNYSLCTKMKFSKFIWTSETINDVFYEKTAMLIPVKFDKYPKTVYFQLDLGIPTTVLYEKGLTIMLQHDSVSINNVQNIECKKQYVNPTFKLSDNESVSSPKIEIIRDGAINGYRLNNDSLAKKFIHDDNTTLIIGSLGYDLIYGKKLIIDFPNELYSICDNIDTTILNCTEFIKGSSCKKFPVLVKSKIENKKVNLFYDTGSSMWELIMLEKRWSKFSGNQIDTLCCFKSWDEEISFFKKTLDEELSIGSNKYSDVPIYTSQSLNNQKLGFFLLGIDGLIGNSLFFDKTILIDTKKNKFGIVKR